MVLLVLFLITNLLRTRARKITALLLVEQMFSENLTTFGMPPFISTPGRGSPIKSNLLTKKLD